jgi:GTPase SAR1 family protein
VGHPKEGKPLEKICIIGQSASGKTSLLELVRDSFLEFYSLDVIDNKYLRKKNLSEAFFKLNGQLEFEYFNGDLDFGTLKIGDHGIIKNGSQYIYSDGSGGIEKLINKGLKLSYISAEIISKESISIFNQNPLDFKDDFATDQYLSNKARVDTFNLNYIHEFVQNIDKELWLSLLHKILNYRKRFSQMASELFSKGTIGDPNKIHREYKKWADANENPVILFADYFNPILQKLNLEVDLVNTEHSIPIKSKIHDEIIPISSLSTGTKGLLLSMFPLFELNTKDAIILLDEPERSLFPDMQIDLISHYQNLAPEAQFVVATHSPFIAAAFEPEERFILYFDDKGKVAVRKGESPIGDDPNDMLSNDFNVDYYNEFGKKAYKEYRDLKTKAISETDAKKKNELILEITKIGDKYNF